LVNGKCVKCGTVGQIINPNHKGMGLCPICYKELNQIECEICKVEDIDLRAYEKHLEEHEISKLAHHIAERKREQRDLEFGLNP
jgi:hypothetical protein